MDEEIAALNEIYKACMNVSLTEQEAISVIAGIVEDRLSELGTSPNGYHSDYNKIA